ncbi:Paraquat-inducible protein A [Candidatus Steffania adelgidicola]|nr:Paraquat-inducible protein A [Candidatus Steffania adelgidicola]
MCDNPQYQHHLLCPDCDLLVGLPPLIRGQKAMCPRCRHTLLNYWHDPKRSSVGFALSALVMQGLANLFPFVNIEVSNLKRQITLLQIPMLMISNHFSSLATMFLLCVQAIPALCMIIIILLYLNIPFPFRLKTFLAKLLFSLRGWGMAEIFLGGMLVSFIKLMAYAQIRIGNSFIPFCCFCLLQLRALQYIDPRGLWDIIMPCTVQVNQFHPGESGLGQGIRACSCCTLLLPADMNRCPRCRTHEGVRRMHSLQWTLALVLTSFILYIPANLLPIMITDGFSNILNSTIITGIMLLWADGSIPIAIMIFIASIIIPIVKMIALAWLCWKATTRKERKASDSERMHRLYEVVGFIGRWSMIDVFVISALSTLVRMGSLMRIIPGIGVVLFSLVVILTMMAAKTFDPRLLWDKI